MNGYITLLGFGAMRETVEQKDVATVRDAIPHVYSYKIHRGNYEEIVMSISCSC